MLFTSKHSRPRYSQLVGSSDALALAQYANEHSSLAHAPLVIIAANALEAQRLREEIPFFEPKLRVHLLPDWETLPYDHFSPHQDLISERLATLHHIRSNACDVVIVPLTTALYPLPPVEHLAAYTFFLKRGEKLNVKQLREQLTFAGYSHVQQVLTPGEYCVRGGIIDLF
ncbi:MAG: transcription-repair coupling factor, partial [Gallionellaceae bacterium]